MIPVLVVSSIFLWLLVLVNVLLTVAIIRRLNNMSSMNHHIAEGLEKGSVAPPFSAETLTGEVVTLANYARKAVSFVFISPDCGPCVDALVTINTLATKAHKAGIEMVLVSTGGEKQETEALIQKHQVTVPLLYAPYEQNSFARDYKADSTPFYCMVNQDSRVESSGFFAAGWEKQLLGT